MSQENKSTDSSVTDKLVSVSLIAAMTKDRVIGKDNNLPWSRIKGDMKHFRNLTLNHVVIMGRKTYDSIGKPLPKRINLVVSSNKNLDIPGCRVFHSFKEALDEAFILDSEPFVIGGQSIYEAAMPYADHIFLTVTKQDYEGDRYFPKYVDDPTRWRKTKIKENEDAEFFLLERISEQYLI